MPKKENLAKQTKQMQIFTQDELQRIENVAAITHKNGKIRFKHTYFFVLLANTGLRVGEAIALTWENVDLEKKMIYVRQNASCIKERDEDADRKYKMIITSVKTKNGNRQVPCNDKAMEALLWLKKYQEKYHIKSKYVDCNDHGEILKQQTLPKILKKILLAADVPYKNIHSFRHTFATNLIEADVDVKIVSQLLGHASVKITYDTYVHIGIDNAIAAVNQLN
jgi:integrase